MTNPKLENRMPRRSLVAALATVALVASGCFVDRSAGGSPGASPAATPLKVGLGYIPSVQFAPFYLAQQRGWYAAAGVNVTFENKIDPDLVTLAVVGAIVGEWVGTDRGLGLLVNIARGSLFDIPLLFATILTIALLGITLYGLVVLVERRLVRPR